MTTYLDALAAGEHYAPKGSLGWGRCGRALIGTPHDAHAWYFDSLSDPGHLWCDGTGGPTPMPTEATRSNDPSMPEPS